MSLFDVKRREREAQSCLMLCLRYETPKKVKAALFHPAAGEMIRSFPAEVRRELGKALYDLQRGEVLGMPLSWPMASVATGVAELRIRGRAGIHRVFYYAKVAAGILVLHAFVKKSRVAPQQELELGKESIEGVARCGRLNQRWHETHENWRGNSDLLRHKAPESRCGVN
jgi:phage-related protein